MSVGMWGLSYLMPILGKNLSHFYKWEGQKRNLGISPKSWIFISTTPKVTLRYPLLCTWCIIDWLPILCTIWCNGKWVLGGKNFTSKKPEQIILSSTKWSPYFWHFSFCKTGMLANIKSFEPPPDSFCELTNHCLGIFANNIFCFKT